MFLETNKRKQATKVASRNQSVISFVINEDINAYVGLSVEAGAGSSFSCSIMRKLFTFSSISSAEYLSVHTKKI